MDFTLYPKITREYILSKFTEEQIMEYYLNIPVRKGLFRSPLRDDKNPTCSFYRTPSGVLIFKDFATGQGFSITQVVQERFRCSYYQALKIIANDFGLLKNTNLKKNEGTISKKTITIEEKIPTYIQIKIKDFSTKELEWWESFGITLKTLKKFQIVSCEAVFLNGDLYAVSVPNSPIYGYYGGKKDGFEFWRCYFPRKTTFRFLSNWTGDKIQGYKQLPDTGDTLVITKSLKDCACLYEFGINAIAPTSETLFISPEVLTELKSRFSNIIVFYDNDLPGIKGMVKIKKEHPELKYIYIPRRTNTKDISDFCKKYGKEKTRKLIDLGLKYLKINE